MAMTKFADERKRAIKDAEKLKNQQEKDLRNDYDTQIFETGRSYEDAYRENAVQKAINERQVAESMANMGLRDSGLNRTQQTAVQLGYANNNAAIDKAKRQAVDSIELQKTRDLASLNQNWLAKKESINQTYDNMEKEYAAEATKAYYQHLTDVAKLQKQGVILTDGANLLNISGRLEDNGVQRRFEDGKVVYIDINTGKSTKMKTTMNPFTGEDNALENTSTGRAGKAYGYYNNGYQPRGVEGYGKFVAVEDKTPYNGRNQSVFKTVTRRGTKYWLWKDDENKYVEVFVNKEGKWEEKVE